MAATFKKCTKCGNRYLVKTVATPCPRCGYLFTNPAVAVQAPLSPFWSLLLDSEQSALGFFFGVRASILALLALMTLFFVFSNNLQPDSFFHVSIHYVNLPFHEAGHVFFSVFQIPLLKSAGGTLMQILMPLICCLTLVIKTRDPFGGAVAFWWAAQNFIDIAPYINDARAGELPLLGGNFGNEAPYGFHDWGFILGELGLLKCDHLFAGIAIVIGIGCMGLALLWGGVTLSRAYSGKPHT